MAGMALTQDLGALVIHLRAIKPTFIQEHMGRAAQQFGLTLIGESNPDLAQSIHDQTGEKPFTASGLMCGDAPLKGKVEQGDAVWIRFTALNAPLVAAFDVYRNSSPYMVELNRQHWRVERIEWAHLTSYQTLIDQHRHIFPMEQITFRFACATTFRSHGVNLPLPLPSLVLGSLLTRWDKFTNHRLHQMPREQVNAFIAHHVLLSRHRIETALYRGKQGGKEIGFVGEATFDLVKKSSHLGTQEPETEGLLQQEYLWMARTINLLADFARFSGIGRKTTSGMGMVI